MMRNLSVCLAAAILVSCSTTKQSTMQSSESNNAAGDGWISLFDGKTTTGWHTYNSTGIGNAWKAENGTLHLDAAAKKTQSAVGGDIVTDDEFENFHLS